MEALNWKKINVVQLYNNIIVIANRHVNKCIINVGYRLMGLFVFRIYFIIFCIVLVLKIIFLLAWLEVNRLMK